MTGRIGFGLVGCGMIAAHHARAISASSGGRLVAVFSRTPDRTVQFAREFGGRAVGSIDELVEDPDVHVVNVTTPSGAHLEPVVVAAAAGRHVLVEKPLEVSLDRIDRMIAACRQANVHLGAVFQARFGRGVRTVKDAIVRGRLGRLALSEAAVKWYRAQAYYDEGGWRGTRRWDGGGALMNQSIHAIDLLQWLVGMPEAVSAFAATVAHERIEVEDTATAALRFANGSLGIIQGSTAAWPGYARRIEINGEHGSVALEDDRIVRWDFRHPEPEDATVIGELGARSELRSGAGSPQAMNSRGHELQIQDMVDAILSGRRPAIDGHEARNAVAIIEAIYRSAAEGRAIAVDRGT
jgi:UDP-N-acetyl-2-amino-2-deoxyglucuronate dehydrogenase